MIIELQIIQKDFYLPQIEQTSASCEEEIMARLNTQMKIEIDKPDEKGKLTVFIIDRIEASRDLKKNISRLGHNVFVAECYADAMQLIAENCCDLIVMDIDLPDFPGDEIISRIKEAAGDISIVTMTENNNRELEQSIRCQRVLYYALKPLEFREINSIIDHITLKKNTNHRGN